VLMQADVADLRGVRPSLTPQMDRGNEAHLAGRASNPAISTTSPRNAETILKWMPLTASARRPSLAGPIRR